MGSILITQGTRPFAQRVARQLPAGQRIVFGAADEMPEVLLQSGNYIRLPNARSSAFAHEMLKICLDRQLTKLIPLGKQELGRLMEAKVLFEEYGMQLLLPERHAMETLMVIENPPAQLPVMVLENGLPIGDHTASRMDAALSGVFTQSDSGDEIALCCIAD